MMKVKHLWSILGPGLLYAGAAIGVSHLVQSTRAGADFGYQLVWAVLLANILKYPFFEYAPRYTAATGNSLLEGYKKLGNWAVILFILMTLGTMFIIQAAVTIVTAGITEQIFNFGIDARWWSVILLAICSLILLVGHYHFLDRLIKIIIILLSITTFVCLITSNFGPTKDPLSPLVVFSFKETSHLLFLVALMGWMPAPVDISVWHSMWSVAKNKDKKEKVSLKDSLLDFNIGFIGTIFMALCFLSLGANIMYGSGESFSSSAVVFAGQLIKLYTQVLGNWAYPIIASAALTTMFSTTLTCFDAFPRVLRKATQLLVFHKNQAPLDEERKVYGIWLIVTFLGTTALLFIFMKNMKMMVDFATTVSFVTAPVLAILNHLVIHQDEVPKEMRPKGWLNLLSWVGMICLSFFGIYYLYFRYFVMN